MPITDNYVVQWLLQETEAVRDPVLWTEKESNGYMAQIREIQVELDRVPNRAGTRLYLTLSSPSERVVIEEPVNIGFFRAHYRSEDLLDLARLMKDLAGAVDHQCAARTNRTADASEGIRQTVYRRLIGAEG